MKRITSLLGVLLVAIVVAACSPEASRTRGGGPGADVGNHSPASPQPSSPPGLPG